MSVHGYCGPNADIDLMQYDRLVKYLALKYGADRRAIQDSEQYADGWVGLLRARDRFDPTRGAAFASYAHWWIEAAIRNARNSRKARRFRALALFSQMGEPTDERPAGVDLALVTDSDTLSASEAADKLLSQLDPRSRRLIERVTMCGLALEEVGAMESPPIGGEQVRRLVDRALATLQSSAGRILSEEPAVPVKVRLREKRQSSEECIRRAGKRLQSFQVRWWVVDRSVHCGLYAYRSDAVIVRDRLKTELAHHPFTAAGVRQALHVVLARLREERPETRWPVPKTRRAKTTSQVPAELASAA